MDVQTMAEKIKAAVMAAQPEHNKGKEKITQFQIIYDCFQDEAERYYTKDVGWQMPYIS